MALLAVRKLLLADDSITIQKIVALTFADAGIEVIAVSNGTEAIEQLRENRPDIVLADVFMPGENGYQVCEYVKRTEKLKHIPVMLLVGSFEPFDEAEARRVGADDTLTKPFQSIRTLMDKVGALLGRNPVVQQSDPLWGARTLAETIEIHPADLQAADETSRDVVSKEADTKELPELIQPPEEPMTSEELEITTADTQPLSPEVKERIEHDEDLKSKAALETTMQIPYAHESSAEASDSFGDALLDLGHCQPVSFAESDDVILDVDFDAPPVSYAAPMQSEVEGHAYAPSYASHSVAEVYSPEVESREVELVEPLAEPEVFEYENVAPEAAAHFVDSDVVAGVVSADDSLAAVAPVAEAQPVTAASSSAPVTVDHLSPEVIDAIARRVVEQMSERAVQEIAWEVVPQLADLMIKRKLEEHETQNR
ncbi:MAG TPA: response regulator [Pyrinomonadaceae bacterium]|nr:response regulator [Pyrinomonadaceae bacterium]